jgi:hypothetical protein
VNAQNSVLSCLKIDPIFNISVTTQIASFHFQVPLDLPVHASCEGFIIVRPEANIENWRSMLKLLNQLSALIFSAIYIIQVDIFIPRRNY